MKITIESTTKVVILEMPNGSQVSARIWQGETESGVPVQCFMVRIAPEIEETDPRIDKVAAEFKRELLQCAAPRPSVEAIPLRMVL